MTTTIHSAIVRDSRLLPGIHGLRGIAALAVVLYHLHHLAGLDVPVFFRFIGRDFGYSVHLFFILSAFSLMHSTEPRLNQPRWVDEYLIKRFFRIAPLFYCILFFELARQAVFGGIRMDFHAILLNLSFTFGFVPFSGFVWGGWSVGVEMIFYAVFPVLLLTVRTPRTALVLLIVSTIVSYSLRAALHAQHLNMTPQPKWDWSYFSFASNICFFAMGLYAYRLSHVLDKHSLAVRRIAPLVALSLIGGLLFFDLGKLLYDDGRLDMIVWGIGLAALCLWQSMAPGFLIANKWLETLGERSFSIYLVHPIIIVIAKSMLTAIYAALAPSLGAYAFFVCAALVTGMILVVAECSYRLIEVPGIELGRQLIVLRRKS